MKNRRKKPGVKLTRAQKKKLEELTRQAKADGRHPSSAQKTIPYLSMYKDGLCRVTENYYTMSLLFDDMNYDLEDEAEQLGIFGGWCSFYSYFDCAVHVQMTGINSENDPEAFARALAVLEREFNSIVKHWQRVAMQCRTVRLTEVLHRSTDFVQIPRHTAI